MINSHRQLLENLLIPVKKAAMQPGIFSWPKKAVFSGCCNEDSIPLEQLKSDLLNCTIETGLSQNFSNKTALRVIRDKNIAHPHAYRLEVTPDGISIYSGTSTGAYYALQTLRDIVRISGKTIPAMTIYDEPDFVRRGVYHDCSRGKVPKLKTLKDLVIRLAHWKINELQLYIENVFAFELHPEIGKGYSPFTPDEILELQEHCGKHHVRLVGSLASFGHFEKILSLPQYASLGEMPGFRGFPGGTTLCSLDSGSIRLIEELYSEFVPLFDADDFNVCCDETWELGKGRSRKRAEKTGVGRIYLEFLLKIYRLCKRLGKRMNLWADIVLKYPELLDDLPRDIVLLNWEYEQDGANIARTREIFDSGISFMVCPGTSAWLTHGSRLSNSMGNVANFASVGRKYHAEGLLNTDWGDQGHRNFLGVSLHGFAHGAAHSWNERNTDDKNFTEKFCRSFFGQKTDNLSDAIKLLGNTYVTCGKTVRNKSLLYSALVEPLIVSERVEPDAINLMTEKGLQKILEQLSDTRIWPKPEKTADEFERLAIKEYELAARMDCLACSRAMVGKKLRAGQVVKKSELQKLAGQMQIISDDFKELWLSRNKLSRLRDNLDLFKKTKRELEQLAGKKKNIS